jgi:hypothetical protein
MLVCVLSYVRDAVGDSWSIVPIHDQSQLKDHEWICVNVSYPIAIADLVFQRVPTQLPIVC